MAISSELVQFPCTTCNSAPPNITNSTRPSPFFPATIKLARPGPTPRALTLTSSRFNHNLCLVRAKSDDSSHEDESFAAAAAAATALEELGVIVAVRDEEADLLKNELVSLFYGTNRGLHAASETRAEIAEVVSKLEGRNPTAAPMEALTLLDGKWILEYTSYIGLYPLLSSGTLPLLKVEEISQTIDSHNLTVENSVVFSGPLATTSVSARAKYEVKSPKRVQIKFEEGVVGTPQLTDFITIPEQLQLFGQDMNLPPLRGLISSVQDAAQSVAKTISGQPPLKFSMSHANAESWLLTTYLDEDLRISKLDNGSAFVLVKEGSRLLTL
uniref:Plastid lipid-associated protein/fibrillin conserved domain-containing protein n=1 Tax=Kalanchoe fedtschenkoi TaxID=63787 RepID=A0A7N0UJL7_KALFE